ncbi:putative mitotic spindle protein [Scheffersomyces stipitis CBS 6054]|uniref:Protein STU1 n=1 Tax=Scheffersomyces stipitis (strain ATCC 58785 / CBS 6054 / NBRC 10063 / NRRL Y-11545) TaxID=322104 RepID=A3LWT8_PICST|nr:putative mitotic spindle protein [Scheffersomyces stipitis CBS 6054]ABN67335.2 putative mitotic spindle protein [Scheffersomyces stipitis CBS 6054]
MSSHHKVYANELFQIMASRDVDQTRKLELVLKLKTNIKKDAVDIAQVPTYFEALSIGVDIPDLGISVASFSTLAHLIKRVSMQDKTGMVLKNQSFLVLPIIINRLANSNTSTLSSARKALEAYWFSSPREVESAILDIALKHRNTDITLEAVHWLHHIISNVNQHFNLTRFVPQLAKLLATYPSSHSTQLQNSIKSLLCDYYNFKQNRLYKFDLARELELKNVPDTIKESIMQNIAGINPESTSVTKPDSNFVIAVQDHQSIPSEAETLLPEIRDIISKYNYELDTSIRSVSFEGSEQMLSTFNDLLPPFNSKETEFNWGQREKNIVQMRSILRGNAPSLYRRDLIVGLKDSAEAICKAVSSLRTTLSSHGCQLVKECAIFLKTDIDSLVDLFMPSLVRLCAATKHIASTNANMSIVAICANASYSPRLLQRIVNATNEKNVQPRSYSGIWLQITVSRFFNSHSFLSSHGSTPNTGVDLAMKALAKLLKDPNPTVRQIAKDSYWCLWRKLPTQSELLLSKLEPKIIKIVERSRPKDVSHEEVSAPTLNMQRSRPSLKETIIERNKDLRLKQRELNQSHREELHIKRVATRTNSTNGFRQNSIERNLSNSHKPDLRPPSKEGVSPKDIEQESVQQETTRTKQTDTAPASKEVAFDVQADPILKFLSSYQTDLIKEGINLLKYAIMGEEELSPEITSLLKSISLRQPKLLEPLLLSNDNLFKRSFQFFSAEDFLRICSIVINPIEGRTIELLISMMTVDELYESIIKLLSYSINTANILGDDELTMQVIKYKSSIIQLIVVFLQSSLEKIPIRDSYFSKVTSNFLELVSILKSTDIYPEFSKLLAKLYSINIALFVSELDLVDINTKEEVEYIVGIDHTLSMKNIPNTMPNSLFELTEVQKTHSYDGFSPVKTNQDFTMIWPERKDNDDYNFIPKSANDSQKNIAAQFQGFNHHESKSEDPVKEYSDNLAQVQICEQPPSLIDQNVQLQTFLDKVDPLKSISNRNKPIAIYEDSKGSPQKLKEHRYSEFNWFNFQVARLQLESDDDEVEDNETTEDDYSELLMDVCESLKSLELDSKTLTTALDLLQNMHRFGFEFVKYYENEGAKLMEESLWQFFHDCNKVSITNKVRGLVLLKQLLIIHSKLDLANLWTTLINVACLPDSENEIAFALRDISSEILSGLYRSDELLDVLFSSFTSDHLSRASTFILGTLSKVLDSTSIPELLSDSILQQIDRVLRNFVNSRNAECRRYAILCYGKLVKSSRVSFAGKSPDNTILDGIIQRFSPSQRRLVEYYSQDPKS